jgi:hypothetical protein
MTIPRIGSLFSGIGGLELGLEAAGVGRTAWQVENNTYCLGVLERHWRKAKRLNDVRIAAKSNLSPVDVICGGFPCKNVSGAGRKEGLEGEHSKLWFEMLRVIQEMKPEAVVVENVLSGQGRWHDPVEEGLTAAGYNAYSFSTSAASVGAPQWRPRVLMIAVRRASNPAKPRKWMADPGADEERVSAYFGHRFPAGRGEWQYPWEPPRLIRARAPYDRNRMMALGNAVVPQCSYLAGVLLRRLLAGVPFEQALGEPRPFLPLDLAPEVSKEKRWPTPVASMACRGPASADMPEAGRLLKEVVGLARYRVPGQEGFVNPSWVEQLMGFTEGWTIPVIGTPDPDVCWNAVRGKSLFFGKEYIK